MDVTETQVSATRELLEKLWIRSLPVLMDRLSVIDAAANAAAAGNLPDDLRAAAVIESHRLAGSLGMFGYTQGTDIAREIENLLESTDSLDHGGLLRLAIALRNALPLNT